jgi:hypothetical protein
LNWTYHAFDKLKVVIMGNGYGVLVYGILDTFLLGHAEYIKRTVMSRQTNLYNIVQNPDERVAILEPSRHVSSPSTHTGRPPTF